MYPHTWFNFDNSDGRFHIFIRLRDGQSKQHVFRNGYYSDGVALAVALNQQISKALTEVDHYNPNGRFSFGPSSLRMSLVHNSKGWIISTSTLLECLGFTRMLSLDLKVPSVGAEIFDINRGRNLMYVFCDVVAHSIIGDIETSLLCVCNTSGNDGEIVRTISPIPTMCRFRGRSFRLLS